MRYPLVVSTLLLATAGCAPWPKTDFFKAPAAGGNTASVRIVGGTQWASITQDEGGRQTGGTIRDSQWIVTKTQDRNMPVDSGQSKSDWGDYVETPVVAGRTTHIGQSFESGANYCYSGINFVPKQGHYYQFGLQVDLRLFRCRGVAYELIEDDQGNWHLERLQGVTWGGKYDKTEDGNWRRMSHREKAGI